MIVFDAATKESGSTRHWKAPAAQTDDLESVDQDSS